MPPDKAQSDTLPASTSSIDSVVKSPEEFGDVREGPSNKYTTVTVLLLIFFYPIGVISMWIFLKKWPIWLKILISAIAFVILGITLFYQIFTPGPILLPEV